VESCPQYLLLDEDRYRLPGFEGAKYVCSPPLRGRDNCSALWQALGDGEIDTMGTDHCSFRFRGVKELGREDFSKIPNGLPGVETRPVLLYTYGVAAGRITPSHMARVLAEQPARLFGMYPRKGVLAVGSDADIVIWDPEYTGTVSADTQLQNVDYTPYEGMCVTGRAETVLLDGVVAVSGGRLVRRAGGRFVKRGLPEFWR
jgi:dihydropyrimidinase